MTIAQFVYCGIAAVYFCAALKEYQKHPQKWQHSWPEIACCTSNALLHGMLAVATTH